MWFIPSAAMMSFALFPPAKQQNSRKKFISKNKEFTVEVTKEQYDEQIAEGLHEVEILSVGKHNFKRGGFQKRHPNFKPKEAKTRINICIDSDILQHF